MIQRVFVKVVGFTDAERHALNTVFRLSQDGDTAYMLWGPETPQPADVALLDADSYEAVFEAASPANEHVALVWVGERAPAHVWRSFARPVSWAEVIGALDDRFAPQLALDLDLNVVCAEDGEDTGSAQVRERALIVSTDPSERLYLRSKLALAGFCVADEAETPEEALRLVGVHSYRIATVNLSVVQAAALIKQLTHAVPHVIGTNEKASLSQRIRSRLAGAEAVVGHASDTGKFQLLLHRYGLETVTAE